jgi:hypothetical protein
MLPNKPGKNIQITNFNNYIYNHKIKNDSINILNDNIIQVPNSNIKLLSINSGPYDYKLFFEENYYPHSVNLSKLTFVINNQNHIFNRTIFLTTGHSFANSKFMTNFGCEIIKTTNINDLFLSTDNVFYSVDDGFNDFSLLSFGSYTINNDNKLKFLDKTLSIISIYKNTNIKNLENEILIKNGHNTGESFAQLVIDFSYDPFIFTTSNKQNYYTFKLNGKIVIINTPYTSGLVLKGRESKLSTYNGNYIDSNTQKYHFEYHFLNTIKMFKHHDLFTNFIIDDSIKDFYKKYTVDNKLSVLSLMGDSGSGFYKVIDNNNIEFVGINICSCYMIVLGTHNNINKNKNIYYDDKLKKMIVGQYYIDEVHKASQVLPIDMIEKYIGNIPGSLVDKIII